MGRIFYNKQFSDYLGENRAILEINTEFISDSPITPTPTPSITPSNTPTPTPSITPSVTPSSTAQPTSTPTPTNTATNTTTPTPTTSPATSPTPTPTPSPYKMVIGSGFDTSTNTAFVSGDTIWVGGTQNYYNYNASRFLTKMNINGTFDPAFNVGFSTAGSVSSITDASDGTLFVGGTFTTISGITTGRFTRVNANTGAVVTGYNGTNVSNGSVLTILQDYGDGDAVIAGSFTTAYGASRGRIARILNGNILDTTIFTGTGFNNSVSKIIKNQSGNYVVVGSFTTYNGATANRIVELNSTTGEATALFGTGQSGPLYDITQLSNGDYLFIGSGSYQGLGASVFLVSSGGTYIRASVSFYGQVNVAFTVDEPNNAFYAVNSQANYVRKSSINPTMVLDTTWANNFTGVTIAGAVDTKSIARTSDGSKIFWMGNYSSVYDTNYNRIVRINSDGTNNTTIT